MTTQAVIVLLGAPLADLNAYGARLASQPGSLYLGDLNLAYGDSVGELLQVYELSQISLQPPLMAALSQWGGHADPLGFLQANRHWSFRMLLDYLRLKAGAQQVIFSDAVAGFRVAMLDRWLEALPEADFIHATTEVSRFVADAEQRYEGRLFIPPEYLDHSDQQTAARFSPALAWFHLHSTLLLLLGEQCKHRCYRIAVDRDPSTSLEGLKPIAVTTPMLRPPQSIDEVTKLLGY